MESLGSYGNYGNYGKDSNFTMVILVSMAIIETIVIWLLKAILVTVVQGFRVWAWEFRLMDEFPDPRCCEIRKT